MVSRTGARPEATSWFASNDTSESAFATGTWGKSSVTNDFYDGRDDFGLADDDVLFSADDEAEIDPSRDRHVMTVLGPVDAGALGITLPHEHLLAAPPATIGTEPDYRTDDRDAALADTESFGFAGGGAIVDCTPPDNGRDLAGLLWVAGRVSVHIIATAGFHAELHSRPFIDGRSVRQLAGELIDEVHDGDPETGVRPGQLKAASSLNAITGTERTAFAAVALAHRATGLPIVTHCEAGTMALEQIELLASLGVDPGRVILSHLDRRFEDITMLRAVLATGATIGFDQLGKPRYGPDEPKAAIVARLIAEGYAGQILLSHDIARRSLRPAYGGAPGLTWLLDRFVYLLLDAGVSGIEVRGILIDNPARALTIHPSTPAAW